MALRNNDPSRSPSLEEKVDLVLQTAARGPVDVDDVRRNVDQWLEADRRFHWEQLQQA